MSKDRLIYLPPGQTRPTRHPMMPLYRVLARYEDTGDQYSSVEAYMSQELPLHIHYEHDEAIFLLEGEVEYYCGDAMYRATPGTFMLLPRGVPHCPRPVGDVTPRVLTIQAPGDFASLGETMLEHQDPNNRNFTSPEYLEAVAKHGWILVDGDFWEKWDDGAWVEEHPENWWVGDWKQAPRVK